MPRQEKIPLVITSGGIPVYVADCTVDEGHSASARVTDHPVERGASITDHVQLEARELRVTVFSSTTPLGLPAREGREREAFAELVAIRDARQLVDVTTSLETYRDMILYKIDTPRSVRDGQSISASLTFKQVVLTSTLAVEVPAAILRAVIRPGGKTKDQTKPGDQPEKPDTGAKRKRLLSATVDGISSIANSLGGT